MHRVSQGRCSRPGGRAQEREWGDPAGPHRSSCGLPPACSVSPSALPADACGGSGHSPFRHRAAVRSTSVLPSELWATDAPDPATSSGLALGVGRRRHHMPEAGWAAWTVPREPHGRAGSHSLARTARQTPRCASGAAWLRTLARAWPCCPEHLTVHQQTPRSRARGHRGSKCGDPRLGPPRAGPCRLPDQCPGWGWGEAGSMWLPGPQRP